MAGKILLIIAGSKVKNQFNESVQEDEYFLVDFLFRRLLLSSVPLFLSSRCEPTPAGGGPLPTRQPAAKAPAGGSPLLDCNSHVVWWGAGGGWYSVSSRLLLQWQRQKQVVDTTQGLHSLQCK